MTTVEQFVQAHGPELVEDLLAWVRIPSVSADPAAAADVRRSAEWLAAALTRTGLPTVEIWETGGAPAVFAQWPADDPAAPTVVVYGHHDVQPVDPLDGWETAPFDPVVRRRTGGGADGDDEVVGRGAIDDKGQVLFHLLGLRAHLAAGGRGAPAVTLKLLVEGEEESGSPHFAELLRTHRDRLACDVVVVSDTGVFERDTPSLCTGMRGLVDCQVDLHGPDGDLHSGSFGGAVPNPLTALARLLAGLHDDAGRVTVPGFYDRVTPLSDRERELFARLPFDEATWLAGPARSRAAAGEAGFTTLERLWARPTAEVNGIWGGYTGPGTKTIIPSDAHAKLSFRLVHDQRPAEVIAAVRGWIEQAVPAGVTATVRFAGPGVRPCLTPLDDPALLAATAAMGRAFGGEILYTREGGSGPEADLAEILAAPVVFLGAMLPDDRIHAPDERVSIPMLLGGARAAAYLWEDLPAALR